MHCTLLQLVLQIQSVWQRTLLQERYMFFQSLIRSEEHTSELQSRFDLVCLFPPSFPTRRSSDLLLPPYLKVDFSDVPALIAGLVFSPLAGILVVFLKNALYFVATGATDPIGVAANFIAGTLYVFPVAY